MKKFRNLNALIIIFILISLLAAGCGGKTTLPQNRSNPDTSFNISQDKDETRQSKAAETDTYGRTEAENASQTLSKETEAATDKTVPAEEAVTSNLPEAQETAAESAPVKPDETQAPTKAPASKPTKEPQPTQAPAKPTEAQTQASAQPPAPKPTTPPSPTQAPPAQTQPTPTQPSPAATLPITVSDKASAAAENIILNITNGAMSEFDKVKAIHDYIVINVEYPSYIDMNNRSLFTAEGALVNKLAVCQGYAEAFSLLCHKAGIQTEMVYGTADNGQSTESHAWNLVRIDGVWYQTDTTWDDPIAQNTAGGANLRYNYFLIPDSVMNRDHTADSYTKKYTCTDSKYLEYGEQQTVAVLIKQNFGDVKYDFASNEADVKKIASANSASGVKNYVIVYNMGQKIGESTVPSVNAAIDNIFGWIPQATGSYSKISFQTMYQYGIKYVLVNAVIK